MIDIKDWEWAKENCPEGCAYPERWLYGCLYCEEQYDAMDTTLPCKRDKISTTIYDKEKR